ncbi:hypothetical protein COU76_05280 [Candidatus Peregrinibacteria bacterium CG10_big_fil_rev_8_21_14_0_10_49_10]|nr:MAG: hypothetical protein COU76_05280 [Candidatus Peregrinibacteria bacterium CG10_big_fil_rev_8_21_14_0_10_49_10]
MRYKKTWERPRIIANTPWTAKIAKSLETGKIRLSAAERIERILKIDRDRTAVSRKEENEQEAE